MQNLNQQLRSTLSLGVFIISFFMSCTNDPASMGIDILPTSDVLKAAADSQRIVAKNILPENILSDGFSKGAVGFLGYFKDPALGNTKADMVAEINVAAAFDNLNLDGVNYFPDSAVLNLYYTNNSWYGKKETKLHLQVYELSERLEANKPYYSNELMTGRYYPELLGEKIISPDGGKVDSVWIADKSETIHIKLSSEFALKLFELKNISTEDKEHRDKIKDIINGLYITLDDEQSSSDIGALLKIDLLNSLTNVTLHYRKEVYDLTNNQVLGVSKEKYIFPINTEGRIFNRFEHDFSSDVIENNPDAPRLFLQGMAGSYAEIDLTPIYTQWKDSVKEAKENNYNIGFSGVDFIFYADTTTWTQDEKKAYNVPMNSQIILVVKNEKGQFEQPTYTKSGNSYAAFENSGTATYSQKTNRFKFSMKKEYFEQMMEENIEAPSFYLRLPNTSFNYNRVVLYNHYIDEKGKDFHPMVKVKYVKF